jgi:23S rRNA G2445 N2-methylase RlmL
LGLRSFSATRTTTGQMTERFLAENGIRYDHIICNAPFGERILINDSKPSGLQTAVAVNIDRDTFQLKCEVDNKL